jgi:DNA-binding CsgD family transcriptional regulator
MKKTTAAWQLYRGNAKSKEQGQGGLGPPELSPLAAASSWAAGDLLSPREIEIVRLVAKGLPNKTIAGVLEISPWTVATYLRRVFAKLGVGSRAAMVARLYELNYDADQDSASDTN